MKAQLPSDKTALVIVDIQNFYFEGGKMELVNPNEASLNAAKLLQYFRSNKLLVVHIKHDFEPGGEIHKNVAPIAGEKIITKNEVNAFNGTDLLSYLKDKQVTNLVICGMQTHMCVEAITRAAYDLQFECTLIADACATRDLNYNDKIISAENVHFSTLSTLLSYATVLDTKDFLEKYK